jgi:RNA-directed DNA polymerase
MKRANHLFEKIVSQDNLYLAFWKAGKGKRYAAETQKYAQDLDKNLSELREQFLTGNLQVGDYQYFKIFDPKEREICAAAFKEQVMHHALMNVCHDVFERAQLFESYASRVGKGTHAAIAQAQLWTKKYDYFLKLDVKKFFANLSHEVMQWQVRQLFKETKIIHIFDNIISSYEISPNRGVPIGNLTSQYLANHYLSGLDRYIKTILEIKGYVRYMDDMVLWDDSKMVLQRAEKAISDYLGSHLKGFLKPSLLNYRDRGLPFLGYSLYGESIRLTQRSKRRYFNKMANLNEKWDLQVWDERICQRYARPLLSFIDKADTLGLKRQFNNRLNF